MDSRARFKTSAQLSLLLTAVVPFSSCAWMGVPSGGDPGEGVKVVVENHSFADMNVFLERDERLFRLGLVMSKQKERFLLPHRMLGGALGYRLVADPVGSYDKVVSPRIEVRPDAVTHWMLEPTSWLSHIVVR